MLLFEWWRSQKEIYSPKLRSKKSRCPPSLPTSPFAWIKPVLSLSDEDTLRMVGLDGYIFLRFLRMCAKLALGCGTFGLIFLLPIYSTAFGNSKVFGINRYTMANITAGGDRLWAPFLCTWIFALTFLYLIYVEYEYFVHLRHRFLIYGDPDLPTQQLYSVLVENVPKRYQSSVKLGELFSELFPGEVVTSRIAMNLTPILAACDERKLCIASLEAAVAQFESSGRKEMPKLKLKDGKIVMCGGLEVVDAIPYYAQKLVELNEKINALKRQADLVDFQSSQVVYRSSTKPRLLPPIFYDESPISQSSSKQTTSTSPAAPIVVVGEPGDSSVMSQEALEFTATKKEKAGMQLGALDNVELGGEKEEEGEEGEGAGAGAGGVRTSSAESVCSTGDAAAGAAGAASKKSPEATNFTRRSISATGFVTFSTKRAQAVAYQVPVLSNRYPSLKALQAPAPNDIIWFNISTPILYTEHAVTLTHAGLYTGLFFWALLLAFISAVSSLSNLEKYLPFLSMLDPTVYALLQGVLPVVILIVFMLLLPVIFGMIATYLERRKTTSDVQLQVFSW
jgi:hypothetical protein